MTYLLFYLSWQHKKHGWKPLFKSSAAFAIMALPFLIWSFKKYIVPAETIDNVNHENWIELYKLACPQNFTFISHSLQSMATNLRIFLDATRGYALLFSFYLLNAFHNEKFKNDKKSQSVIFAGTIFFIISFMTSYIIPNKFVTDLNLVRNSQFMLLILMAHTVILLSETYDRRQWLILLPIAVLLPFIRFSSYVAPLSGILIALIIALDNWISKSKSKKRTALLTCLSLCILVLLFLLFKEFSLHRYSKAAKLSLYAIITLSAINYFVGFFIKNKGTLKVLRKIFIIIPFFILLINYIYYHHKHIKIEKQGKGFWQMQRNWIDMQNYVKKHTPTNAYLLVPHDMEMGGFRIFSERKIICSYRDCGIIGFDYNAAVEWQKRLKDIGSFQVFISRPVTPAITNAILKYKVNYIVFMNYLDPGGNSLLRPVYRNDVYSLYQVIPNPI